MPDLRATPGDGEIIPASFSIRFSPSSQLIVVVRRFVESFYARVLRDPDLSSQLALATHELLENSVKYGLDNNANLAVTVDVNDDGYDVIVTIRNEAIDAHIVEAEETIAAINASDDIFSFYQQQIQIATERDNGSKLGLVRIAAEAGMSLTLRRDGTSLEISAMAHFNPQSLA
ncbi:MAG: hypothetical protein R3A79_31390 [Nannocystaceae bacterium]